MNEAFDFIAMPKGQLPGGPVQSSAGDWLIVLPATVDLVDAIELVERQRRGRPVTDLERQAARASLDMQPRAEK